MGFYYGLAYRLFDLGEWVCFSLLVVSTVDWGCLSSRLGFRGCFWFVAFRPAFSSPCSFYPSYWAGFSLSGRVRGFELGDGGMDCSWRFWTKWPTLGRKSVVPRIVG